MPRQVQETPQNQIPWATCQQFLRRFLHTDMAKKIGTFLQCSFSLRTHQKLTFQDFKGRLKTWNIIMKRTDAGTFRSACFKLSSIFNSCVDNLSRHVIMNGSSSFCHTLSDAYAHDSIWVHSGCGLSQGLKGREVDSSWRIDDVVSVCREEMD